MYCILIFIFQIMLHVYILSNVSHFIETIQFMDIGFVNSFFFQVSEIAIFNLHIQKKCLRLQLFLLFLTLYWVFEIGIIN